jgi:hypothetical protein
MRSLDKSVSLPECHVPHIRTAANSGMKVDYAIDEPVRGSYDISCTFLLIGRRMLSFACGQ